MSIELHQFRTLPGFANFSPFCMKVETWLRLAGLDYQIVWEAAPHKAPLGKLPFVRDGSETIADSHSIIARLAAKYGKDLDAHLDAQQKAAAHAFDRLLSEHFYWALLQCRWLDDGPWQQTRQLFFGALPAPLRIALPFFAQRGIRAQLQGHGLGRHPREEILRRAAQDLQALSDWLGDKPFFMGDAPTTLDASAYAFLANAYEAPIETALKPLVAHHANLVAYCARMRQRCFAGDSSSSVNLKRA